VAEQLDVSRRLAAVFAADVEGYSRLMGADEVGTLRGLTERRAILDKAIADYRGRIANTAGDSVLAEFSSAVDAVSCALQAQAALGQVNAGLSPDKRIAFRIGIHVGDVMVRAGDLFGDSVNIAARLQTLAEAGGICVSGMTHDQVRKVLPVVFTDLGPQQVKNIEEPIRVFAAGGPRVSTESSEGARSILLDPGRPPLLPNKPSIAVLPFQNMSGDPEQEYFADGMVEDIITALSRFKSLFVIARNSSFAYKGKTIDIKQVGRELGVRYVLEGSVRKAGSLVRITGQLIEAASGAHIWANKFDGTLENIFELQDTVAANVVGEIVPQLILADANHLTRKPPDSWDSYDHYLRGLALFNRRTLETNKQAQLEFEAAIALDPNFALPYVQAAFCMHLRYWSYLEPSGANERADAMRLATRALELAPDDDAVLSTAAFVVGAWNDEVERGIALADRALHLNPNLAQAWGIKGYLSALMGDLLVARHALDQAIRLSPLDRGNVIGSLRGHITATFAAGALDEQAVWARKLVALNPTDVHGLLRLYYLALLSGDANGAENMIARIMGLYPDLRKPLLREMYLRYRRPEHQARMKDLIERIEIPE
jgi:TolB-like protein/class 3 adenylate cyclase